MKPLFTILAYLTAGAALATGAISFFIRLHNNLLRLDVYASLDYHVCCFWNSEDVLKAAMSLDGSKEPFRRWGSYNDTMSGRWADTQFFERTELEN